ncbi:aromatase/cyclase [Actinoplanes sp. L3-i22]|uniref:aromatase/cyclase n=1 Tax=Actinoplanes sp. L3-i22 TaxID=2836373 RepID=UPI001C781E4B|nr:aromatase/cyclase [Actinoplanes sp. L3-i22]BCY13447.1 actinorhodin polyketide synthase bifunctional cyclase/dehydratase [Actinoplanes sp. L3-i22]
MPLSEYRTTEHDIVVAAPATKIYQLLADIRNWPRIFPPTIHVEHFPESERDERIQIWATAQDQVKSWISRRRLDPDRLRIQFRQEVSQTPVAEMGGSWIIEPLSERSTKVRLLHDYRADSPENLNWVDESVDRNSRTELGALKANIEADTGSADKTLSFQDTVRIDGPASAAFAFVNDADRWIERLPHVSAVRFEQQPAGIQVLEMDTRSPDGSTHTTKSYRVAFPSYSIVYKQVTLPALLSLHTGRWSFTEVDGVVEASSQHTIVIDTQRIGDVLGPDADLDAALEYARNALSANSQATLALAKRHAETGIRV